MTAPLAVCATQVSADISVSFFGFPLEAGTAKLSASIPAAIALGFLADGVAGFLGHAIVTAVRRYRGRSLR